MPQTRKAFHFDLDTKKLASNGAPKDAWNKIRVFLEREGFEHVQYSGYESKQAMKYSEMNIVLEKLQDKFPWFVSCAKDARVTSIAGRHHNALTYMRAYAADRDSKKALAPKECETEPISLKSEANAMTRASEQLNNGIISDSARDMDTER